MKYQILIKSHTDWPDYESECEADSKEEALRKFTKEINLSGPEEWKELELDKYVDLDISRV